MHYPESHFVLMAAAPGSSGGATTKDGRKSSYTELSTVDFLGADMSPRALARYANRVQIADLGADGSNFYEEAAVLYANGSDKEAEAALEVALSNPKSSANASEGLWMMLLDLYRLMGEHEKFDAKVLEYATRFEKSPPPWQDMADREAQSASSHADPVFNMVGALNDKTLNQLAQITIVARRNGSVKLDVGRVSSCEETGVNALAKMVKDLKAERSQVTFRNTDGLIKLLDTYVREGDPKLRDVWMLLLTLLQYSGNQEEFENTAIDYAVTFEESPPSWDTAIAEQQVATDETDAETDEDKEPDSGNIFVFEGELSSADDQRIRDLAAYAEGRRVTQVDCSRLRRMDFVSAGLLFNILTTLQAQNGKVVLRDVNAMVGALLRVMGVDQIAKVLLHR